MGMLKPGKYDNGEVVDYGGAYVWIPNDLDSTATATIVNPGQGSFGQMCVNLYDPIINQGTNQIVVIPKYASYMYGEGAMQSAYTNSRQYIADVCNKKGVTLTTINTLGSSAGDRYALKEFSNACRDGVDNGYCVITGASTIHGANQAGQRYTNGPNWAFLTDEEYSYMQGKTVYVFEGKAAEKYSYVQALVQHGVNVVLVECKSNGHDQLSWNPLHTNIFDLLDGNPDAFLQDSNYSFWKCVDPNNMVWISLSEDELREISSSNYMDVLLEKYPELSDFAEHYKTSKNDTLASNLVFVSNSMNDLKSNIVAREDFNYSGGAGEAQIINAMYSAADYYSGINNKVYSNLSAEADAVYAIANAIFKMDDAASMVAETSLTDGVKGLFSTSNPEVAEGLNKLDAATQNLLDNASSLCDTTKYESLQGMLTTGDGNIGKMSKSAINDAVNSIVPVLQQEVTTAQGMKSSLESFMSGIGAGNMLQGGVWDNVAKNLEAYGNLLDSSVAASEYMQDVLETALGMYINFFDNANKEVLSGISSAGCGEFAGSIDGIIDSLKEFHDDEEIDTNNKDILDQVKSKLEEVQEQAQQLYDENKQKFDSECVPWPHQEDECTGTDANGNCTGWRKVWVKVEPSVCEGYQERMAVAEAAMNTAKALQGVVDYQLERIESFIQITEQASQMMMDAIDTIRSVYENPADIMEGNGDFKDKFKLDLSKYGIDDSTNYKQLLNDYYKAMNPDPEPKASPEGTADPNNPAGTQNPSGNNNTGGNTGGGNTGGGGGGGGVAPGPNVEMPTKDPTVTPTTTPSPTTPTVTRPTYTTPTYTTPTPPSTRTTTTSTPTPTTPSQTSTPTPTRTVVITTESGDEIVAPTEPKNGNVVRMGNERRPSYSSSTTKPNTTNPVEGLPDEVIEEPIIEEPIIEDFSEQLTIEPEPEEVVIPEVQSEPQKDNKTMKTMGIAAGIGLAVGGAALGAHQMMKAQDDDEDDDYGYDK